MNINKNGQLTSNNISELGPTDGLVGYWPLNGDTLDYSGNGNDGVNNGATITSGNNGKLAYEFDGVSNGITIPYNSNITPVSDLTLSSWVKSEDFGEGYKVIILKTNAGRSYCLEFYENHLDFSMSKASSTSWDLLPHLRSSTKLNDNMWHHVASTYNGIIACIYIDGVLIASQATTGNILNTESDINIAHSNRGEYANGMFQDVRIYNRALSPEEVKILYDMTAGDKIKMKQTADTLYVNQLNEV